MTHRNFRPIAAAILLACLAFVAGHASGAEAPAAAALAKPALVFPLDRTAYIAGERVPLAVTGVAADAQVKIEAVNADGRVLLYDGKPVPLLVDTARLAPGLYTLEVNGAAVDQSLTVASSLRKSPASLQDESLPPEFPDLSKVPPPRKADTIRQHRDAVARTLDESGLTAAFALAASDEPRNTLLDAFARTGTLLFVNSDTRPTSFFPIGNDPAEIDGMSQRMLLTAQANGRYPNFAGFCFGWDTTGYAVGGRKGLMTYWGWGNQTDALRSYIARGDKQKTDEFTRRTGLQPVSGAEYISYLLSIGRPELAPAIDLPTKRWLEEIARHAKPLPDAERAAMEKRLDAWSQYLMGLYREAYAACAKNLRDADPSLRNTASVQVDHCAVQQGQYFPSAYEPLDLQYQSTWNDQVGGPDYAYQWLFVTGMLNMQRAGKPIWISNALAAAHGRAPYPGKFARVAAHNLAHGGTGIGFACEAFSNVLAGMNKDTNWKAIKGKAAEQDLLAGRDFLERFAPLALAGRGDHGVGILFSKSQFSRQYAMMGFGTPQFQAFIVLTRLGYTPRFVTEDEVAAGQAKEFKALVVIGQTVPLPEAATAGISAFAQSGGKVFVDGSCSTAVPNAAKLALTFPFSIPGKPHSWSAPNMALGENDSLLYARWHPELARAFSAALGDTGRALLVAKSGPLAETTLMQLDGGADAKYVVAINDSYIQTQADWRQLRETLAAGAGLADTAVIYDCTDERLLGKPPVQCELAMTTVRLYAILPRELRAIGVAARQQLAAGEDLVVRADFRDAAGKPFAAALPFNLSLTRPDGRPHQEFYRATDRDGAFAMTIPLPANAPAGTWTVSVRSQLTGDVASLPVTVAAPKPAAWSSPLTDAVVVREKAAIAKALARGTKLILPLFDSPHAAKLLAVAEKVKAVLAAQGVDVEIRQKPELTTYWLAYDPTDAQKSENARADKGETIGKIKRTTVNANDWFSALGGYRCGVPVLLLDLAGEKDNEIAEALDKAGLLWPQVSDVFPGKGRAVVQGVHWAFGPRVNAVVIQAADADGLLAGAAALANLPDDNLTPVIQKLKADMLRQHHVGGTPARPDPAALTSDGLKTVQAPRPFIMRFLTERPPAQDQAVTPRGPAVRAPRTAPGVLEARHVVPYMRDGDKWIEAGTAEFLVPDLRFSDGLMAMLDVKAAGKTRIVYEGVFRYNDRGPCWQAQWEDILALRDQLVPKERRPIEVEVLIGGKAVGTLTAAKTEQLEVPLELRAPTATVKPKSVVEEVVTRLSGDIELPAGRQDVLFVPRNIVDGKLKTLHIGAKPE
jgi:hypothetical protein